MLANHVYGVKTSICVVLRGVMDCLGSSGAACTDSAVMTAEKINEDRLVAVIVVLSRLCTVQVLALYITSTTFSNCVRLARSRCRTLDINHMPHLHAASFGRMEIGSRLVTVRIDRPDMAATRRLFLKSPSNIEFLRSTLKATSDNAAQVECTPMSTITIV